MARSPTIAVRLNRRVVVVVEDDDDDTVDEAATAVDVPEEEDDVVEGADVLVARVEIGGGGEGLIEALKKSFFSIFTCQKVINITFHTYQFL